MEGILTPMMYDIPSDPAVVKAVITKDCVEGRSGPELTHDPKKINYSCEIEHRQGRGQAGFRLLDPRVGVLMKRGRDAAAPLSPVLAIPSERNKHMELTTWNLPVLALRGLTVFPHMTLTFDVERQISIRALERAMEGDQAVFLVTQREIGSNIPGEKDLYEVGTISHITQILRLSSNAVRVMVEGRRRARLRRLWQTEPFLQANIEELTETAVSEAFQRSPRTEALLRQTWNLFGEYAGWWAAWRRRSSPQ